MGNPPAKTTSRTRTPRKSTARPVEEPKPMTARLVKVNLVPTFVIDDGEGLTEVAGAEMVFSGREWQDGAGAALTSPEVAAQVLSAYHQQMQQQAQQQRRG